MEIPSGFAFSGATNAPSDVTIKADMSAFHGQANAQIDLIRGWDAGWGCIVWPIITELSRFPSPCVSENRMFSMRWRSS
jgi:hypothetical protein